MADFTKTKEEWDKTPLPVWAQDLEWAPLGMGVRKKGVKDPVELDDWEHELDLYSTTIQKMVRERRALLEKLGYCSPVIKVVRHG